MNIKKISSFSLVLLFLLSLAGCGSSGGDEVKNVPTVNSASWSKSQTDDITKGCMESEGSPSRILCECISSGISSTYTKDEWDKAYEVMSESGQATQAYMDIWSNCENKFGTAGDQAADGPTQDQLKQYDYPDCVQVLAPGNSGLTIRDNKRELGRADGMAGYCILPNSGGEKYYYQGR